MKKLLFFFFAFFALNFLFSQIQDLPPILDSDGDTIFTGKYIPPPNLSWAEDILEKMPKIDQIRLEKHFLQKNPCPASPKKPVFTGHRTSKPALVAPMPIINIIGSNYDHVDITNNGTGFHLVVDKKEPGICSCQGDPVICNPGLIGPIPDPVTYPTPSNPGNGKGIGFGGEGPAFLFGLLIALAGMVLYFLGRIANRSNTPHTPLPTAPAPNTNVAPASVSHKTETPFPEIKKKETAGKEKTK